MIHEKCGNELRYVTMYTVITTKAVFEVDEEDEGAATFTEVKDEELSQTVEVYCNTCNQKLNLHETEIARNNLYAPEDDDEREAIRARWEHETEDESD